MPIIVNLSTIHTLYPISRSVAAFVRLSNQYSKGCLSSCPGFFTTGFNYASVLYQYHTKYNQLIAPYKLGKITTEQFLQNLLRIFNFLDETQFNLLIEAWNEIIGLDEDRASRFPTLLQQSEPVYLISNTNELNVLKILHLLQEQNPDIKFNLPIDLSVKEDNKPVEIAPNVFLCLSYRFQLFKTKQQTSYVNPQSTMSLINHLINDILAGAKNIQIISQYEGDLAEARRLGIDKHQCHQADTFFIEQENQERHLKTL